MDNYNIRILPVKKGIELVKNFPRVTYTKEFFSFVNNKYGFKGGFLIVYKKNRIILILPVNFSDKKIFSVFKNYTEPLFVRRVENFSWKIIINKLRKEFGFQYIEFRFCFIINQENYGNLKDFKMSSMSCYVLETDKRKTEAQLLKFFKKKTRNQVRKSLKEGFNLRIGGVENLDQIYELYKKNMQRHGTPPKSKDFFRYLFDCYNDKCKAFLAYYDNVLVGVNIALTNAEYLRLMFNFSNTNYWSKCINNFLYFKMIKWGNKQNIRYFDFGPSSYKGKSHIHFKRGFGGTERSLTKLVAGKSFDLLKKWFKKKKRHLRIVFNRLKKSN